jgi:hypothetical protein
MAPRDPWANLSAVQWTPELIGAMANAVACNRAELDAMQESYAREQMAGAQDTPEQGYEVENTK